MKKIIVFILLSYTLPAFCQSNTTPTPSDIEKLKWLEGTWTRTNTKPGRSGHERWMRTSETEWRGWGISMNGKDTLFVEKLKLLAKDGAIYYVADVPENTQPVYFKFSELTDHSFTCENPQHDFPKKIAYQKEGNKLKAVVSGDGKVIDYLFEKK